MIPSFDRTDFRQYEGRVRLFVSQYPSGPERRAGKLLERLHGWAFDSCEGLQDVETPKSVDIFLEHLRLYFLSTSQVRKWTSSKQMEASDDEF